MKVCLGKPVPLWPPGSNPLRGCIRCIPYGPGLGLQPRGFLLLPSPVRPLSGSPPLAGSALGRSASGAPLPGCWGSPPFCFVPPCFAAFWLFLFCVLVRDHSWMRGAIPRSDVGTHIGSRFSTLAKRTSGSLKGFVCERKAHSGRYQRQLRLASSTQQVVERRS